MSFLLLTSKTNSHAFCVNIFMTWALPQETLPVSHTVAASITIYERLFKLFFWLMMMFLYKFVFLCHLCLCSTFVYVYQWNEWVLSCVMLYIYIYILQKLTLNPPTDKWTNLICVNLWKYQCNSLTQHKVSPLMYSQGRQSLTCHLGKNKIY